MNDRVTHSALVEHVVHVVHVVHAASNASNRCPVAGTIALRGPRVTTREPNPAPRTGWCERNASCHCRRRSSSTWSKGITKSSSKALCHPRSRATALAFHSVRERWHHNAHTTLQPLIGKVSKVTNTTGQAASAARELIRTHAVMLRPLGRLSFNTRRNESTQRRRHLAAERFQGATLCRCARRTATARTPPTSQTKLGAHTVP